MFEKSMVQVMGTKIYVLFAAVFLFSIVSIAQNSTKIPLPTNLEQGYPRLYFTESEKKDLQKTIKKEAWAQEVLQGIHNRIDDHVKRHETDPEWMVSRLMMYWKTKATNVYVNGIYYSHADGETPVPTVRFTGSRDQDHRNPVDTWRPAGGLFVMHTAITLEIGRRIAAGALLQRAA